LDERQARRTGHAQRETATRLAYIAPGFLFGLERRFAEYQIFPNNCAIDFPVAAVAVHECQRLEKPNPLGKRDCDTSSLLKCLEDLAVSG
jgi:hypothetical protein